MSVFNPAIKNKAPKKYIAPNSETHQMSPSWLVVFWSFDEPRVGIKVGTSDTGKMVMKKPLIVMNDAVSVRVSSSKRSPTKSASIRLKLSDIAYDEKVRPQDYVGIWMCQWQEDIDRIVGLIQKGQAANDYNSGLKFLGRVSTLSRNISVDQSGTPDESVEISAEMFTELNSSVYVTRLLDVITRPLGAGGGIKSMDFFSTMKMIDPDIWKDLNLSTEQGKFVTPDIMIRSIAKIFLAQGTQNIIGNDVTKKAGDVPRSFNNRILVPKEVRSVLGAGEQEYLNTTNFFTGIQEYDPKNFDTPSNVTSKSGPFHISKALKGSIQSLLGNWDNVSIFSLWGQYLNPTVNELYTCLKYVPGRGIRPTITARQIPFSTPFIVNILKNMKDPDTTSVDTTLSYFANLPRWEISPRLISSVNIGFGFGDRINMVRVMANSSALEFTGAVKPQEAQKVTGLVNEFDYNNGNFFYDTQDIVRNGLSIQMTETMFDIDKDHHLNRSTSFWTAMRADFQANLGLKLSGRIGCSGIQEPICEGDNIEMDGIVYHIESIDHMCQIFPSGNKKFMTQLSLSNGTGDVALQSAESAVKNYPAENIPHVRTDFARTIPQPSTDKKKG
jgi:hypothetical protein